MEEDRAYHHGDLPTALLQAVDAVVRERGVAAVSLREVARRAEVSHAAPAHHFGDKAGLLTAYAAQGFEALRSQLEAAQSGAREAGPGAALFEVGLAYVRFAVAEPGRFQVMFRPESVRAEDPQYRTACDSAFAVLYRVVGEVRAELPADDPEILRAATGAWAIVHGFATLWLDGNLDPSITAEAPADAAATAMGAFGSTLFAAAGAPLPAV